MRYNKGRFDHATKYFISCLFKTQYCNMFNVACISHCDTHTWNKKRFFFARNWNWLRILLRNVLITFKNNFTHTEYIMFLHVFVGNKSRQFSMQSSQAKISWLKFSKYLIWITTTSAYSSLATFHKNLGYIFQLNYSSITPNV